MAIKPHVDNYLLPDSNCGICVQRSTNPKDGCVTGCALTVQVLQELLQAALHPGC